MLNITILKHLGMRFQVGWPYDFIKVEWRIFPDLAIFQNIVSTLDTTLVHHGTRNTKEDAYIVQMTNLSIVKHQKAFDD